jgi:hypothetical protein
MPTLPQPQNPEQVAQLKRVNELLQDGYIVCVDNRWLLTDKGWRVLSAAADSKPQAPQRPTKAQMQSELETTQLLRMQGWKWLV